MIVEAHTVGQDNWTTLPDQNGHTSDDLSADQACTGGWSNPADEANVLHPFLQHYQTFDPATGTCSSTGTTGEWNAANGSSSGRQQLQFDLSAYANQQVEISITSVSDWASSSSWACSSTRSRYRPARARRRSRTTAAIRWTAGLSPARPRTTGIEGPNATTGSDVADSRSRKAAVATPRHALHGLRPRGHHGCRHTQPGHGSRDRLPAALTSARRAAPRACRPSGSRLLRVEQVLGLPAGAGRDAQRDVPAPPLIERPIGGQHGVHAPLGERLPEGAAGRQVAEVADDVPVVVGGVADVELVEPVGALLAARGVPDPLRPRAVPSRARP